MKLYQKCVNKTNISVVRALTNQLFSNLGLQQKTRQFKASDAIDVWIQAIL